MDTSLLRKPSVLSKRGRGNSQLYREIADGLMTPGIRRGAHCTVWPAYEIDAINRAEIAGATPDELRALVRQLVEQRTRMRPSTPTSVAA